MVFLKFGHSLQQLLDMLKFYTGFEINDVTGNIFKVLFILFGYVVFLVLVKYF